MHKQDPVDSETEKEQNKMYYEEQLKKYANDLANVFRVEKERRREIETTNRQLINYAEDIKRSITELKSSHKKLREAYLDTVDRLVLAAELKDGYTAKHLLRMSRYCELIGRKAGLSNKMCELIRHAAPIHDIGKIGIPDSILNKNGKLTKEEFEIMKTHTTIGASILKNSRSEILNTGEIIAISHHEKWNGSGYPYGLKGEAIPIEGRIASIADVFDALTSKRQYKEAFSIDVACGIIEGESGESFDPELTDIFFREFDDILKIKNDIESV